MLKTDTLCTDEGPSFPIICRFLKRVCQSFKTFFIVKGEERAKKGVELGAPRGKNRPARLIQQHNSAPHGNPYTILKIVEAKFMPHMKT